jgi:type 1 glutamine amidotransferase
MFRFPRRTLTVVVAAAAALLAAGRAMAADAKADAPAGETQAKKKVVFIAGGPSHGFGAHDHKSGCYLLAKRINQVPGFEATVYYKDWPEAKAFDGASAVVMYCDGGNGHMALPHLKELQALHDKGVGIGCIHYAVEPGDENKKDGNGRAEFLDWIGGYFETFYSINPTWQAHFDKFPQHPVANGVRPFTTHDEWYYHMRFRDNMEGVTPIFSAVPPDSTRQGKDDAHGGNPHVREGIGKNLPETVVWVSQNKNGSRGFGCSGAHYHWNWAQDDFRKGILNAIVWIAKGDVPANGVESSRPTMDELMANQDEKVPANFDKAKVEKQIEEMNKPHATAKAEK